MIARNAPCPCGSGRKFKRCCGTLPGDSWTKTAIGSTLPPAARSLLLRGLRCHVDAEFEEARELYRAALAAAPQDPELLHKLALVEYRLHDLAAAEAHLQAARASASGRELQAIERSADHLGAAVRCRQLRHVVLDPSADPIPPASAAETIHILSTYDKSSGGAEWRAINLGDRLARHRQVRRWTELQTPNPVFDPWSIERIDARNRGFPDAGTLVIVGCYFPIGAWIAETHFRRVILIYNVLNPADLVRKLELLARPNLPKIEIVYASELMRLEAGLPGRFVPSPIDLRQLQPGTRAPVGGTFTAGRLSRDDGVKFDRYAGAFFRALAAAGTKVRIMGGTSLAGTLGGVPNIELLPANAESAVDFLQSLDVFTYRTQSRWPEPWGRVVSEAMAVGLPVVVHANGGYVQIIRHGENGFVFHRDEEALSLIATLRSDPALRARIGAAARQTVVELLGDEGYGRHVEFYLR